MHRWIHVDFKYMPPTVDALEESLTQWAHEGATGVLFEWENMFPYPGLADTVRPDAYSPEEIARIIDRCRTLNLQAVPLVQTLGHLEWLLSGPALAHLREFDDSPRLIRACDPAALELLGSKIDALLAAHSDSPYIHLGGDEARGLDCIDRAECSSVRDGPATIFMRHLRPLLDHVIRAGKRPILWADMPLHYPQRLEDFPRETVFCDWLYHTESEHGSNVRDWAHGFIDSTRLVEVPADRRALFEPYWSLDAPGYPNLFFQHPYAPFLRDHGFDVIGASAVIYAAYPLTIPPLSHARANARCWLRTLRRFGGLGAVNTCWAVRGALREVTMTGHRAFLYMANRPHEAENDARIAASVWAPIAGDRAAPIAQAVEKVSPPLDPLTRTAPFRYDPRTGMSRLLPFDERRTELSASWASMDDEHPETQKHRNVIDSSRQMEALLEALPQATPETCGWVLSLRETALRAEVWLALRNTAQGQADDSGQRRVLRHGIEQQANAMRAFMHGRYPPEDIRTVLQDRYDGLLRLLP